MSMFGDFNTGSSGSIRFAPKTNFRKLAQMPWSFVALIVGLAVFGTAMLYSSTITNPDVADLPAKHLTRFAFSFVLMIALALTPLSYWKTAAIPAYVGTFVLLIGVEFFGDSGGGAQRWLVLGPLRMQPSEVMKLALVLAVAQYYHAVMKENSGGFLIHIPALALILAPSALVLRQPDLGTTLTLVAAGGVMIYFAGIYWRVIFAAIVGALAALVPAYLYVLEEYQRDRIRALWDPTADPLGANYQGEQAKIAIGSGGFDGKGFTQGTQSQLDFIPEQHTDFIFTVVAEEFGFLGAAALLLVWLTVIVWGFVISIRSHSLFGRFAGIGAVATMAFYVAFNVGMVAGLLPVVGIPLPLISYGGTAMITVMAAFGLILSVYLHREDKLKGR